MEELDLILTYTKNIKVLYVEDDADSRMYMKDILEEYFTEIDIAVDGKDGLEKYKQHIVKTGTFYDLVITDMQMPNMTGLEMSEEIIKYNSQQPIVVVTAHNEVDFLQKAIELNVDGYLIKPIDNTQLYKVLYKVTQSISNYKAVDMYIELIEDVNLKLESVNKQLILKNEEAEKSLRVLNTVIDKEKIATKAQRYSKKVVLHDVYKKLIEDDLEDLIDILTEIDLSIIQMLQTNDYIEPNVRVDLKKLFARYAEIIYSYDFFENSYKAIEKFSMAIASDKSIHINTVLLLESVTFLLGRMHKELSENILENVDNYDTAIAKDLNCIISILTDSTSA